MIDAIIPSSQKDRQALKNMIVEITNSLSRIDAEREHITSICADAEDKFEIKKKLVRKIASTMYKHNYSDVVAENDHFELLYETLIEGRKAQDDAEDAAVNAA